MIYLEGDFEGINAESAAQADDGPHCGHRTLAVPQNVPHTATHELIERVHRGADPPNHGGGSAQHRP